MGGGNALIVMEIHKFNGDFIFLFYGLTMLCILSIIFSYVHIKPNKYLNIWNSKGYSIYLWQNFSFIAVFGIVRYFPVLNNIISVMLLIFIMSTLTSFPIYWIEQRIQSSLCKLKTHFTN